MGAKATAVKGKKFGTFAGVFTPSILTILGVIMFLRAGFVIGEAGIKNAILILLGAEIISLLTAFSMGAIATNTPVKGGGAYFLISRALGPQYGGAIGLALYLAQALSVPFYVLGFTNSLVQSVPAFAPHFQWIALGTAALLFLINYISTSVAIKSQYIVMGMLVLSITAFLGGSLIKFDPAILEANMNAHYSTPDLNFWAIFAIYFPAVTGILAGVNMSGDLKDPSKSLVRGTLAAIVVGFVIYLAEIILSGGSQLRADLIERPYEMLIKNALFGTGFLVMGGVFAATISSAIGSFLGAPRVLQAVARDKIFKSLGIFGRGTKDTDEPRIALWLTLVITLGVIYLVGGQDSMSAFDLIAAIVTMFFLCTYGMINLAAFVESFGQNPSFRPKFRCYHWSSSLLGFLSCFAVMLRIDAAAAMVAVIIIAALYGIINRRVMQTSFGDARRGFMYSLVIRNLQKLRGMQPHPKNWRPTILALTGSSQNHFPVVQYADWMEGGCGLVTAAQVVEGDLSAYASRYDSTRTALENFLQDNDLEVFSEVVFSNDVDDGIRVLVQAHSIGPLKPNTVVIGWPRSAERAEMVIHHLNNIKALGKSAVTVVNHGLPEPGNHQKKIDIWWRGQKNGSLMIILAHLICQNWDWRNARIRILRKIDDEAGRAPATEALAKLIEAARIKAEPTVLVSHDSFDNILHRHSREADLLFMGFDIPEQAQAESGYRHLEALLGNMPTTLLVHSSGEADLFE
ncbi:amino acid permease [Verrucomicrobiota bacterium]